MDGHGLGKAVALHSVQRTTVWETHGMGDILGYARVSTGDQDVAGQTMRLEGSVAKIGGSQR